MKKNSPKAGVGGRVLSWEAMVFHGRILSMLVTTVLRVLSCKWRIIQNSDFSTQHTQRKIGHKGTTAFWAPNFSCLGFYRPEVKDLMYDTYGACVTEVGESLGFYSFRNGFFREAQPKLNFLNAFISCLKFEIDVLTGETKCLYSHLMFDCGTHII